jgi:uncharacterized protein (UPF0332 family)
MLRPSEFLSAAKRMALPPSGVASDAELRRSISTSYYALFHTVLASGADRLFGTVDRHRAGYAIVYRSFDHGRMKRVCEDVARSALASAMERQLKRRSLHPDLRDFATSFVALQAIRHGADYDPDFTVDQSKALAAIDRAERAIAFFTAAPDDERSDLLALMLASGRG